MYPDLDDGGRFLGTGRTQFQNPPVVEIWAEFSFQPRQGEDPWTLDIAKSFIDTLPDEYSEWRAGGGWAFNPIGGGTAEAQPVFEWLRASSAGGSHWVQLRKNALVCNVVKTSSFAPRYQSLREYAEGILEAYVKRFFPERIDESSLAYSDVIELREQSSENLNPHKYFNINIGVPQNMGRAQGMRLELQLKGAKNENELHVRYRTLDPDPDRLKHRFRFDWRMRCPAVDTLDLVACWKRMDEAHDQLWEAFCSTCKDSALQLFQPEGDE